jgi:hypothetical protein
MDETDALQLNDASTLQPQVDDVKQSSDDYKRSAEESKFLEVLNQKSQARCKMWERQNILWMLINLHHKIYTQRI